MITLDQHQVDAVEAFRQHNGRLILDGKPGTGKTFVGMRCAQLVMAAHPSSRVLYLTKAGVVKQTRDQAQLFFDGIVPKDFAVMSYHDLLRDDLYKEIRSVQWTLIIVDESHSLNNTKAKWSRRFHSIPCQFRLAMSGTLWLNGLHETFSMAAWIRPDIFETKSTLAKSRDDFMAKWFVMHPVIKDKVKYCRDEKALTALVDQMIHHIPKTVLDLPDKKVSYEWVELSESERADYEAMREDMLLQVEDAKNIPIAALGTLLIRQRQFLDCPWLLEGYHPLYASKVISVLTQLRDRRKTIVFCELAEVAKYLHKEHGEGLLIHGGVSMKKRDELLKQFTEDDSVRVMFGSPAMMTGLNIQAAKRVIHYGVPWHQGNVEQRHSRMWRRGQTDETEEVFLLVKDSVDEKMLEIIYKKNKQLAQLTRSERLALI